MITNFQNGYYTYSKWLKWKKKHDANNYVESLIRLTSDNTIVDKITSYYVILNEQNHNSPFK